MGSAALKQLMNLAVLVLGASYSTEPGGLVGCAGRTGRAGCTGVSVVLVDKKKEGLIARIEQKAGMKFERIGAPQPADMARVAGDRAAIAIRVLPSCITITVFLLTICCHKHPPPPFSLPCSRTYPAITCLAIVKISAACCFRKEASCQVYGH